MSIRNIKAVPASSRMARKAWAWLTAAVALFAATAGYAQVPDPAKIEIRTESLGSGVYMLTGGGGNMALLTGSEGAVLVDDQFAPLAPKIRAAIALLTDRPLRFVINTHWHFDHTGGNEAFGRSGSVILAHANTRKRMSTRQVVDLFNVVTPPSPAIALPVITFEDGTTLHLDGEDIVAEHAPKAHTDSDIVLYFTRANVVHTGDVFVVGFYPFIDMGSGGSVDGVIAACERVLLRVNEQTRIIPGHGPLATRKDLADYRDMLVAVRARIVAMIRKGSSQAAVLDAMPTKDFDDRYGKGVLKPEVFVQRLYVDLARTLARRGSTQGKAGPGGT